MGSDRTKEGREHPGDRAVVEWRMVSIGDEECLQTHCKPNRDWDQQIQHCLSNSGRRGAINRAWCRNYDKEADWERGISLRRGDRKEPDPNSSAIKAHWKPWRSDKIDSPWLKLRIKRQLPHSRAGEEHIHLQTRYDQCLGPGHPGGDQHLL